MKYKITTTDISEYNIDVPQEKSIIQVYLDSVCKEKWSFWGIHPFLIIQTQNGITTIQEQNKFSKINKSGFDILEKFLKKYKISHDLDIPFIGGAMGFIGYEGARYLDDFSFIPKARILPEIWMGFFDKIIAINQKSKKKILIEIDFEKIKSSKFDWKNYFKKNYTNEVPQIKVSKPISNFSKKKYLKAIKKAKQYIYEGDIYQVNFSHRLEAKFQGNESYLYKKLRLASPTPFGAFIKTPDFAIYSASPERFIKITGNKIQTRPIKGTISRGKTPQEDKANKYKLLTSEKDKAELMMIVDLERNDLGKICEFNSVKTTQLICLEKYEQVFHLVGTIEGKLKKNISPIKALKEIFPGGSITGAPKIRACEIIAELETEPREAYTGCIGYFGFDGNIDTNIAIRTMYTKDNRLYLHVGGGIVADSDALSEWEETKAKAKGMLDAFGGTFPNI